MSTQGIKVSFITSLYRPGGFLEPFLDLYLKNFSAPFHELMLVHNDPTEEEERVITRYGDLIDNLRHICVERESVYASWNRAIKASSGEYLATWNVDDRRTLAGIQQQVSGLDQDSEAMMITGDYIKVLEYGSEKGLGVNDRGRRNWLMSAPRFRNGCFLMWRRLLHQHIGYFDEQLKVSGDREFWYRTTRRFRVSKAQEILGYYLRGQGAGISRTNAALQNRESVLIAWRYAIIVLVSPVSLKALRDFRIREVVNFAQPVPISGLAKRTFLSALPSFLLFFVPFLIRLMVEIRFAMLSLLRRGQKAEDVSP
jgi:glycosyltransferase involved in cell wall biosynthesis